MRDREVKPGMVVETKTVSEQPILCTVLERYGNQWLLDSPEHGYAIYRYAREFKPIREREMV